MSNENDSFLQSSKQQSPAKTSPSGPLSPITELATAPSPCSPTGTNGAASVDLSLICPMQNPACERQLKDIAQEDKAVRGKISPRGSLGLPPLLDARRLEYGIIDEAFNNQPVFDRIYVWQLPLHEEETFMQGGAIVKPDWMKARDKKTTPRGILVAAGLSALDTLRSHGIDIGHIVTIIAIAPWTLPIAIVEGHWFELLMLRDGDIVGSDDLATTLRSGVVKTTTVPSDNGARVHKYTDAEGKTWNPVAPFISDDQ